MQQLLVDLGAARTDDHDAERDAAYPAQPLAQQGVDDAVAAGLRIGSRRSIVPSSGSKTAVTAGRPRSGLPIPDERLEADPAAELTVQEAAASQAANR